MQHHHEVVEFDVAEQREFGVRQLLAFAIAVQKAKPLWKQVPRLHTIFTCGLRTGTNGNGFFLVLRVLACVLVSELLAAWALRYFDLASGPCRAGRCVCGSHGRVLWFEYAFVSWGGGGYAHPWPGSERRETGRPRGSALPSTASS